jgi:hypothetical protein
MRGVEWMLRVAFVMSLPACTCTTSVEYSRDEVGHMISARFLLLSGLQAESVECPELRFEDSDKIACTVKAGGQAHTVEVTRGDGITDLHFQFLGPTVDLDVAEPTLAKMFSDRAGFPITLACGEPRIRLGMPGARFDCESTWPDGVHEAYVTVSDQAELIVRANHALKRPGADGTRRIAVSRADVAEQISTWYASLEGVKPERVDCPVMIFSNGGAPIDCTLRTRRGTVRVSVTASRKPDGQLDLAWRGVPD